jgi:hypothetical protein
MATKKTTKKAKKVVKKQGKNAQSGFIENEFLVLSIIAAGGLLSTIMLLTTF